MADPAICETSPKYSLLVVLFYHCPYGSARRKLAKFLHNVPDFQEPELYCEGNHQHETWGQAPDGHWSTAAEAAYPWELCKSATAKLLKQLQADGAHCCAPGFALQEASLQCVRPHPANVPIPENDQKLSTPHRGYAASAGHPNQTITVGIHTNPTEFVL